MRGDRLVSILLLLQANGKMTAKQLAEKMEVSERTIYRDMDALSGTGIPVIADQGKNGGWRLLENYRTNLTGLKESEIRALFVPQSPQLLKDLGLTRTSEEARNKLMASLPESYRHNGEEIWNRIHVDTGTWRKQKETIGAFDVLKEAIWKNHKIKMEYRSGDGTVSIRIVEPLGLVAKGSRWYFIASKENGEIRNYRASRILSAFPLEETFKRPEDFNLSQYWNESTNTFIERLPNYDVQIEAAPSILPRLTFTDRFVRLVDVEGENNRGWIPVKLSFNTEEEAKGYILGFGNQIKVIEPKELQEKVFEAAQSIVDFYSIREDD
ncbi:helix-turn-helix transcriptional regulator [Pseudalkalibacillus salsuginis]|uniref:helix-turn-helix transcriptional regulator n=1 Tax=Pseudalkalibacillus salsuginis TaxID=2910972 RepID=UPI001F451661|nr:YafY family protein [Pseudalkalibacillus salsuginis]MCF6409815.1 YafY family transcriptional regulator [Pseudalkalibacillus salsuginis]